MLLLSPWPIGPFEKWILKYIAICVVREELEGGKEDHREEDKIRIHRAIGKICSLSLKILPSPHLIYVNMVFDLLNWSQSRYRFRDNYILWNQPL